MADSAPIPDEGSQAATRDSTGLTGAPKWPKLTIRWYESWVIRAATVASFILFCGITASAFVLYASYDGIKSFAINAEVEETLAAHLSSIKKVHDLHQQLVIERLTGNVTEWLESHRSPPSEDKLRDWILAAGLDAIAPMDRITFTAIGSQLTPEIHATPLEWKNRNSLRVLNYELTLPKGELYRSFKAAEDIRQRYQLIGANLEAQRPEFLMRNGQILAICFVLLASLVIFYARRFKRHVEEVIEGFSIWSDQDAGFRFGDTWKGELRLITSQFNAMADDVEANRQRSLYLEKIASWQIIARKLAHEIKNPLTPIQMMVSQLKRRYRGEDPDFQKLLTHAQEIISEEVAGLRRMVDNFSNFARLPEPEPKAVDLVNVCTHVVELQKVAFENHDIRFESSLTSANGRADEDLLRQVLLNLIKNAAEACGETPSRIVLTLLARGHSYEFHINDNGPGIPPELQSRIFEAYFTTKHTGPSPGMGLGLAVCQKIVMDHGGKMSVNSQPGDTTFTIALPKNARPLSTVDG